MHVCMYVCDVCVYEALSVSCVMSSVHVCLAGEVCVCVSCHVHVCMAHARVLYLYIWLSVA